MSNADLIADLVLERLGSGDASHVILLVSVRRALNMRPIKGDLSTAVTSALRRLVDNGSVTHEEGIYSLGV